MSCSAQAEQEELLSWRIVAAQRWWWKTEDPHARKRCGSFQTSPLPINLVVLLSDEEETDETLRC